MIGRGAHGSPWIFREVNAFLENRSMPCQLLRTEVRDIILEHLAALYAFHGESSGVRIARKHIGWYCQQHTDTESFRPALMAAESSSAQFSAVAARFGEWALTDEAFDKNKKASGGCGNASCDEPYDEESCSTAACA